MRLTALLKSTVLFAALAFGFRCRAEAIPPALVLTIGEGRILDLAAEVRRVYTSNPEVVDVVVIDSHQVAVNAKASGKATMAVWLQPDARGESRAMTIPVTVNFDLAPIQKLLDQAFPDEKMTVSGSKEALVLLGRARKAATAERALGILKPFAQSAVSGVEVIPQGGEKQIALHVLFAELDRTVSDSFGVNLLSTGAANTPGQTSTGQFSPASSPELKGTIGSPVTGTSSTLNLASMLNIFAFRPDLNLAAAIQALQAKGLLQILARPDLVTTDGKEAHFTVGGEFPVPVPQTGASAGAITVQFREFGIRLSFTPSTTPNGTLKLHVQPEVSTLDAANGIVLSGFNIPAISTRKVETEVELSAGQSFAIAGLLDERVTQNLSKIPGIGDLPVLGALFRSHSRSRSKTELIVVVTPELRSPLEPGTSAPLPAMPEPFLPNTAMPPKPASGTHHK
jgi:pilus assembly protein CpaC